ncbi:glycoside hydrolase 100 family protein [Botrimarina sp.]|uniref:amylo-alpha-1,6-glucosidase n=1 Tax=Botrimarina sp. TaxID=2795802 RepID=UPI0032EBAB3D
MSNQPEADSDNSAAEKPDGWRRAIDLLHACRTEHGFVASPSDTHNYRRVWGRDSSIMGLAALVSDDAELVDACRQSLETLAEYQGPHGEIPSNVDPATDRVSYGGTAGRVDADLWFVIGCGEYWRHTRDEEFLQAMLDPLEKVRFLLGAWEFNTRGLLYIPPTGDWADEYLQSGYVLYDQLLYLQVLRTFCRIHRHLHGSGNYDLDDRVARLKHLIRANYWIDKQDKVPDDVYHEVLYEKARGAAEHSRGVFWMPFFSPVGYGYRFDSMANVLAMLLDVADDHQCRCVDDHIAGEIVDGEVNLLPAFAPVITPKDEDWQDLQMTFSHTFKNAPHEYHNGGLWPLVTGFYAASLAKRGETELARRYADGVHAANRLEADGEPWGFPEYLHGTEHTPGGTKHMGWSAAAAIVAEASLAGRRLFE